MTGTPNPVPGLFISTDDKDPGTRRNMQRISLWSKQISPVIYATGDAMAGILPVPAAPQNCYLMITGHMLPAFTSGYATIDFPQPFPNGVLSVQLTLDIGGTTALSFSLGVGKNTTTTTLALLMELPVGTPYTGNADVIVTAVGW